MAQLSVLQVKMDGMRREIKAITATQAAHAKKIQWITAAALVVIGAIGGPDAVTALSSVS
jgi:hypothetical protein